MCRASTPDQNIPPNYVATNLLRQIASAVQDLHDSRVGFCYYLEMMIKDFKNIIGSSQWFA